MLQREKELNGEQRAIVDECINSPSPITIIQGKAGSGKSFLVKKLEKVSGLLKDNYNIDINDESMRYINGFGSDISHADCQTVKDYSKALVCIYERIGAYGRKAFVTDPLHGYPLKGAPKQMLEEKKEQKSKMGGFFRKVLGIKLILIAIVMMCFVSCGNKLDDQDNNKANITEEQEETILEMIAILNDNNEKPKGKYNLITNETYALENGKVVCHRKIDGRYLILSRIDKNREVEKRFLSDRMRYSVYNGDKKTVMLLSTLSKLNLGMDFVYHGIMHRDTVQIAFTPKEIVKLANDKRNPIEDALNSQVEETKIMLPVVLDYETIWKNLEIKDGYLTFYYEIDEDVIDIESVYQNIEALRDYLSSSLFGLKQDDVTFMPKAKACGLGMRYLYIGDITGKQFSVDFENNELR